MKLILMPIELADKIVAESRLPTSDGRNTLPVNIDTVRSLIAKAITEDRNTKEPDFDLIGAKVCADWLHGETLVMARNTVLAALRYAQSGGARFTQAGPSEADYAEAVQNAVETFSTSLKDKGLWK